MPGACRVTHAHSDQTQVPILLSGWTEGTYVTDKYIGTLGCEASLKLCVGWLNMSRGKASAVHTKLSDNIVEANITRVSVGVAIPKKPGPV